VAGLRYRIKKYFVFSGEETKQLLITIGILGFILSFHSWGTSTFNLGVGVLNLILSLILLAFALVIHVSAQKIVALYLGYKARYKYWLNGLLLGLFFAFFTFGFPPINILTLSLVFVPLFFVGTVDIEHHHLLRTGKRFSSVNFRDLARVAYAGVAANIIAVIILQFLYLLMRDTFIGQVLIYLIAINLLVAIYSMLPFPNTTGLCIYRSSRPAFVFLFVMTFLFSALILASIAAKGAGFFTLILALLLASLVTYIYNRTVENT